MHSVNCAHTNSLNCYLENCEKKKYIYNFFKTGKT